MAADGHRTLALGQGAELLWTRQPKPLSSLQVIDIFRRKTAPAFEVALRLGALAAGPDAGDSDLLARVFRKYSEALGIAYQIRDDVDDLAAEGISDLAALRPSLPLAVAHERAAGRDDVRPLVAAAWTRTLAASAAPELQAALTTLEVEDRCRALLEAYKEEAVRTLVEVDNPSLKGLLRRVVGKIFNDLEVKGWCGEFEARNAADRPARAAAAG